MASQKTETDSPLNTEQDDSVFVLRAKRTSFQGSQMYKKHKAKAGICLGWKREADPEGNGRKYSSGDDARHEGEKRGAINHVSSKVLFKNAQMLTTGVKTY